jgi:hypothetical protein
MSIKKKAAECTKNEAGMAQNKHLIRAKSMRSTESAAN